MGKIYNWKKMSDITADEVLRVIESTPIIIIPEGAASRPPTVAVLEEIIAAIRTEMGLQSPNPVTLHALMIEMQTTQARLMEQAAQEIRETGRTTELGETPEQIAETVSKIQRLMTDILVSSENITRRASQEIETRSAETVDNIAASDDDEKMSATTDKDYIDARLKAMSDSLDHRLETAAVKSDGRLEVIETRMDARVEAIDAKLAAGQASMEQLLARKFAEFDSTLHKSTADTVKWVAGTVLALGVIGISLMTFLLNNVAPKSPAAAPAPLIFYGQPAPAAAPPVAPATK